jgi:hypothetical protein
VKVAFLIALAVVSQPALAKGRSGVTGFTCTAENGETKRLNVDLKRGRYDQGEGEKRLARVTDSTIVIDGPNSDLMRTPMGPVLRTVSLDRTTLVLTDETLIPDRAINRTASYQCAMGPAVDFSIGRRF